MRIYIPSLLLLPFLIGCGNDTKPITSQSSQYEAAEGPEDAGGGTSPSSSAIPPFEQLAGTSSSESGTSTGATSPPASASQSPETSQVITTPPPMDLLPDAGPTVGGLTALAEDATLDEAIEYFGKTNDALRLLTSGRTEHVTNEAIFKEAKRISQFKLAAADNALELKDLPNEKSAILKRNKLEALSQLTGLRDVKAAERLEAFAKELIAGTDAALANEGRVVQIGFEMDRLRSGQAKTPDDLIAKVKELTSSEIPLGIPAFYALRQCFVGLRQYQGYGESSRKIRDEIIRKFDGNEDPQVSLAVNELKIAQRFDLLDTLQEKQMAGEAVEDAVWRDALKKLLAQSDTISLQYASNMAIRAEQDGNLSFAKLVVDELKVLSESEGFEPALAAQTKSFVESYAARTSMIGQPLEIAYPDLSGAPLDWKAFRGKVVLMPFWQANPPQTLFAVLPTLSQIRDRNPDSVSILGVNLDTVDEELSAMRSQVRFDFANVRNPDVATRGFSDPLAKQLGCVSLPFVVVVDQEGKVHEIMMGPGKDIEKTVASLLGKDATEEGVPESTP